MAVLVHVRNKQIEKRADLFLNLYRVMIVEDEKEVLRYLVIDFLDNRSYQGVQVGARVGRVVQEAQRAFPKCGEAMGNGCYDVFHKDMQIAIKLVQSIPAHR